MRLLHTSDWHLGRSLLKLKRYDEFAAFLEWLIQTIEARKIETLVVAGDIFDNTMPSNRAQELYYRFLGKAAGTHCSNIVIVAGNHDSPTLLDAPKEILKAINVHVIGTVTDNPEDEVIVLKDRNNKPQAIVCAIPYLRDSDIRTAMAGETIEDKATKLLQGLQQHYAKICGSAEIRRQQLGDIPIIATGHLFTAGGKTAKDDGVRELYVGTIAHVSADLFPDNIDYLALGHLHVPQQVGSHEHFRYSGSPIPMNFGEANQQKIVIQVDFDGRRPIIEEIAVPCFRLLEKLSGTIEEIKERLAELFNQQSNALLEIEYTGQQIIANLDEEIFDSIAGSRITVTRTKNCAAAALLPDSDEPPPPLDSMTELEVFDRCLNAYEVPEEQRPEMIQAYKEILKSIVENDANKE